MTAWVSSVCAGRKYSVSNAVVKSFWAMDA